MSHRGGLCAKKYKFICVSHLKGTTDYINFQELGIRAWF